MSSKEIYWIAYYESNVYGYNMTSGGDGNDTYSKKTESEMDEIKEKIKKTKVGSLNPHSRKIKCKNIETNEELHFETCLDCCKYFNRINHNFITTRCTHKTDYLYDGKWMIAYEEDEYPSNYTTYKSSRKSKSVSIINEDTNEEFYFHSFAEAEKYFNLPKKYFSAKAYLKGNQFKKDHFIITII